MSFTADEALNLIRDLVDNGHEVIFIREQDRYVVVSGGYSYTELDFGEALRHFQLFQERNLFPEDHYPYQHPAHEPPPVMAFEYEDNDWPEFEADVAEKYSDADS